MDKPLVSITNSNSIYKPLVSIIIVNWNGGEMLSQCLNSLEQIDYPEWELILVDNGSADGSDRMRPLGGRNLKIIKNKENLGFAKANNQGYKIAKGKYVLLLNNDTKVAPDILTKLVAKIESDPSLGVVQPKIRLMFRPEYLDTVGSYLTWTGFLQHRGFLKRDSKVFDEEKYIFSAKGACMLIRKEVIELVGLFDEDYGSYMEETDFCWRVWLAGYKIVYYPKAYIYHRVGFTSKRQDQIRVNYNSFKNRIATLFKNLSLKNLFIMFFFHWMLLTCLSFYFLIRLKVPEAVMIWKAMWWNIKNMGVLIKKRSCVQHIFREKNDEEIFKYILKKFDWQEMLAHFIRSEHMLSGKHEV